MPAPGEPAYRRISPIRRPNVDLIALLAAIALVVVCMAAPIASAGVRPSNDDFDDAIAISGLSASVTGTNLGATSEPGERYHQDEYAADYMESDDYRIVSVWWKYTAPRDGRLIVDAANSSAWMTLGFYTGDSVDDLDIVRQQVGYYGPISVPVTAGTTYYIAADGDWGDIGTVKFDLRLSGTNDEPATAVWIPRPAYNYALPWPGSAYSYYPSVTPRSFQDSTAGSTRAPGEVTHAGVGSGGSIWYRLSPVEDAYYDIDTSGSSFDTALALYSGSPGSLTPVSANDDVGPGRSWSRVSGVLQGGTQYFVAIDGAGGATGDVHLSAATRPFGDEFRHARNLNLTTAMPMTTLAIDMRGTTVQTGEPDHALIGATQSTWLAWTAPTSATVTFSAVPDGSTYDAQPAVAVYTGAAVESLTEVAAAAASGTSGASTSFAAVAGTTYRFAIANASGLQGRIRARWSTNTAQDSFSGAVDLTSALGGWAAASTTGSTLGATRETGEPTHAGGATGSVWYRVTIPSDGSWTFDTYGSSIDTTLGVYTGGSVGALTPRASNDDAQPGATWSRVTVAAVAGETLRIAVDSAASIRGTFALRINPPSNDAFAEAAPLAGFVASDTRTTIGATVEAGEPPLQRYVYSPDYVAYGSTVWYRWTAPVSRHVSVDTLGSDYHVGVDVYTGGSLATLALEDRDSLFVNGQSTTRVNFEATAGTTYYVRARGLWNATGTLRIRLNAAPDNDKFAAAQAVASSELVRGSLIGASREAGEPAHAGHGGTNGSVWYRWTAPSSGTYWLNTHGSSVRTSIGVYTGFNVSGLVGIAAAAAPVGGAAQLSFDAVAGRTYRIAVGSVADAPGAFELRVNPPANDHRADAAVLADTGAITASINGARTEPGEPLHAGRRADATVWYSWTPTSSVTARFSTAGSAFDTALAVYTESGGMLTPVGSSDNAHPTLETSRVVFSATAATTYLVAVAGVGRAQGQYQLSWNSAPPNDPFASPTVLTGSTAHAYGSNHDGSAETGEPDHAGVAGTASVWYEWAAPAGVATTTITTAGSAIDTVVGVYVGASVASLTPVASDDDGGPNGTSRLTFASVPGNTYRIAVAGKGSAVGDIELAVNVPDNDDFANAITFMSSTMTTGFTGGSTLEVGERTVDYSLPNTIWYRWVAPYTGSYEVHTNAASTLSYNLTMYQGTTLETLSHVDDFWGYTGGNGHGRVRATAGTEYYFQVAGNGSVAAGQATFEVRAGATNTDFAARQSLAGWSVTTSGNNFNGMQTELAHDDYSNGRRLWYEWTAPATGTAAFEVVSTSSYDPILKAYTGSSLDTLHLRGTGTSIPGTRAQSMSLPVVAGTTYMLSVGEQLGQHLVFSLRINAPPLNDAWAAATATSVSSIYRDTIDSATREDPDEPVHGAATTKTLWYQYTAPAGIGTGEATVDLSYSAFDTAVAVYTGTALSALVPVGSDDDSGTGDRSWLRWSTTPGTTYYIAVAGKAGASGSFEMHLGHGRPRASNDDFTDAQIVGVAPFTHTVSLNDASHEGDEPQDRPTKEGNCLPGRASVWYRWTAPTSGTTRVDTRGSSFDTYLAAYTGASISALSLLGINGNIGYDPVWNNHSELWIEAVAGTTYHFRVDGCNAASGTVAFSLGRRPINDDFAAANVLDPAKTRFETLTAMRNLGATAEASEPPHAGVAAARSTWHSWTAPATRTYTFATSGATVDTRLAVYTGATLSALMEVASNDDRSATDSTSSVSFAATAGTVYLIAIDANASGTTPIIIDPPTNDNWDQRQVVSGSQVRATGTTLNATRELSEPDHGSPGVYSTWYSWTAPASDFATFDTLGSTAYARISVFRGASLATLDPLGANAFWGGTGQGRVRLFVEAGTTYSIAVSSPYSYIYSAYNGPIKLNIDQPPVNDHFGDAMALPSAWTSTTSGSSLSARTQADEPSHGGGTGGASVWYTWTPALSGNTTIETTGSAFDTTLGIYTGTSVDSLTEIAANDDVGGVGGTVSAVRFAAVAGTTYYIAVDGFGGRQGDYSIVLNASPPNDDFPAAFILEGDSARITGFNTNGTDEPGESPVIPGAGTATVWYEWTPDTSRYTSIDTFGSSFDTVLGVFTGAAVGSLAPVATNDDIAGREQSLVSFLATAGTTYRIAVSGVGTDNGDVVVRVNPGGPEAPDPVTPTPGATTALVPDFEGQFRHSDVAALGVLEWEVCRTSVAPMGDWSLTCPEGFVSSTGSQLLGDLSVDEASLGRLREAGQYVWRIRGVDIAGVASAWSAPQSFQVQSTPPAPALVTQPVAGSWARSLEDVVASASDVEGLTDVTVLVDGVEVGRDAPALATSHTGDWDISGLLLADGAHDVLVRSEDEAGNVTDSTSRVYTDATSPAAVRVTGPAAGTATNAPTLSVAVSGSDVTAGVVDARLLVDGVPHGDAPLTFPPTNDASFVVPADLTGLTDAEHTVSVQMTDRVGNSTTSPPQMIVVDRIPPSVNITSVTSKETAPSAAAASGDGQPVALGAPTSGTSAEVMVGVLDNHVVEAVGIEVDGALVTEVPVGASAGNHVLTWNTAGLPAGDHDVVAVVRDRAGNVTRSGSSKATIDRTAPTAVIATPSGLGVLTGSITATGVVNDASGVRRAMWLVDSRTSAAPAIKAGGEVALTLDTRRLADGTHNLDLHAWDALGNTGRAPSRRIVVDNHRPTLAKIALTQSSTPTGLSCLAGTLATFGVRAADVVGLARLELLVDGVVTSTRLVTRSTAASARLTWPLKNVTAKDYVVTFRAVDGVGLRLASKPLQVCVDRKAPTGSVELASVQSGATTEATLTGADDRGIAHAAWMVNGTIVSTSRWARRKSTLTMARSLGALAAEDVVTVRLTDAAGRVATTKPVVVAGTEGAQPAPKVDPTPVAPTPVQPTVPPVSTTQGAPVETSSPSTESTPQTQQPPASTPVKPRPRRTPMTKAPKQPPPGKLVANPGSTTGSGGPSSRDSDASDSRLVVNSGTLLDLERSSMLEDLAYKRVPLLPIPWWWIALLAINIPLTGMWRRWANAMFASGTDDLDRGTGDDSPPEDEDAR